MNKEEYSPGIDYRQKKYQCSKPGPGYYHFLPVDETYEQIHSILKAVGVTRIGNITGLDRIGIPVVNVIRPNMEGYAVQHGKGITLKAAKVSAGMEAIERYYGSHIQLPSFYEKYRQLRDKYNVVPHEQFSLSKHSLFHIDVAEWWTVGWDIINREEVAVPYNLVSMLKKNEPEELDNFLCNSNGLAAGIDFLEAICQGLLEVIERDAVTCHEMAAQHSGADSPLKRIDTKTIPYAGVRDLLGTIEAADIMPILFDCECDTGVPTFNCFLIDRTSPHEMICHGMGASLNSETSLLRAITEAAQARAVYKGGARDIYFQDQFFIHRMYNKEAVAQKFEREPANAAAHFRNEETKTFEGDIALLIEKLKKVGINQVIVLDISPPQWDVKVVRVIVPGLEGYVLPNYTVSKRGKEYLMGKKI